MKAEILINEKGQVKIILVCENDLETLAIQMLSKVEVETSLINSVTQILDKQIDNGLVIKQKTRNTNS
jgi:hypothetical protein